VEYPPALKGPPRWCSWVLPVVLARRMPRTAQFQVVERYVVAPENRVGEVAGAEALIPRAHWTVADQAEGPALGLGEQRDRGEIAIPAGIVPVWGLLCCLACGRLWLHGWTVAPAGCQPPTVRPALETKLNGAGLSFCLASVRSNKAGFPRAGPVGPWESTSGGRT